jgi:hypothetical protein
MELLFVEVNWLDEEGIGPNHKVYKELHTKKIETNCI